MRKKGVARIIGLIAKTILITLILLLIQQTYAQEFTPEIITTTFPEVAPTLLEQIERFYEISERSLEIGYNVTLDTPSVLETIINNRNRYIIANNFSQNSINLIFIGSGKTLFNQKIETSDSIIFKIEDLNLQFTLHFANKTHAQVELKLFRQEIPPDVDYFELFDIQVRLAQYEIYSPTDLTAMIEFTNFGEGPSHIRLIYSIINIAGKEFYTGIDEKIVETDQVMIKNFDTLDIPNGQYIIRTTIYYGDNQEATSEESFTLKPVPKTQILKQPLLFIGIVLASFIIIVFLKKRQNQIFSNQ
ncbi:hypothetical protein KAT36_02930 [Candidatus Pacearchaeota archaeon]|nr:hypothetical protein [Candidatus Pacearchaeota archaeon]